MHLASPRPAFTGDEPRYASEGIALYSHGTPTITTSEWTGFLRRSGLAPAAYPSAASIDAVRAQSIVPGLVFGPFVRFGNLDSGRAAAFALFCFGLAGLSRGLRRAAPADASWVTVAIVAGAVALSMPLVAYSDLMYADVILFALVAWAVFAILDDRLYLAVVLAWLLPIVHIRSFPLALGFLVAIAVRTTREPWRGRGPGLIVLSCILAVAFVAFQFCLYGTVTGPAFSTTQPSFGALLERLGFALFGVRQGIVTYAPLYLIGFAGLVAGALRRNPPCLAALGALGAYVLGFIWSDASESWPARFWVAAVPLLGIGIAYWLCDGKRIVTVAVGVPLFVIGASNLVLFAMQPDLFLENRRSSITYAILYNVAHVHFGTLLPIDGDAIHGYAKPLPYLLAYGTALVALLAWYRVNRSPTYRDALGIAALGLLIVPFAACAFRTLPDRAYRVTSDAARGTFTITPYRPADVSAIQLDDALPIVWAGHGFPNVVDVECRSAAGHITRTVQPSRALILTPGCAASTTIRLAADPPGDARRFTGADAHLTVMQRAIAVR